MQSSRTQGGDFFSPLLTKKVKKKKTNLSKSMQNMSIACFVLRTSKKRFMKKKKVRMEEGRAKTSFCGFLLTERDVQSGRVHYVSNSILNPVHK